MKHSKRLLLFRNYGRLIMSIICFVLYLPHYLLYLIIRNSYIPDDVRSYKKHLNLPFSTSLCLIYLLHTNPYFRTLFYHRLHPALAALISWWRPGNKYFIISKTTEIGPGAYFAHSFATEINAKSIGSNFSCRHLTTLGNKFDGDNTLRPTIGDNVVLGVNVTIIGNIVIGNNVTIGAGSVVVKSIPSNTIVAGNPARIISYK